MSNQAQTPCLRCGKERPPDGWQKDQPLHRLVASWVVQQQQEGPPVAQPPVAPPVPPLDAVPSDIVSALKAFAFEVGKTSNKELPCPLTSFSIDWIWEPGPHLRSMLLPSFTETSAEMWLAMLESKFRHHAEHDMPIHLRSLKSDFKAVSSLQPGEDISASIYERVAQIYSRFQYFFLKDKYDSSTAANIMRDARMQPLSAYELARVPMGSGLMALRKVEATTRRAAQTSKNGMVGGGGRGASSQGAGGGRGGSSQ
jgi:hypothetical protein